MEAGLTGIALLGGWLFHLDLFASERWDWRDVPLGMGICLPMLLGFVICVRWPVGPLRSIKRFTDDVIRPLFASSTLVDLAIISLMAGMGEELFFRGLLQALLIHWLGMIAGLVLASTLFGVLHLVTPAYAVMASLMGLYLGCWYLATGSLLAVAVAHAVYDFVALIWLVKSSGSPTEVEAVDPAS